MTHIGEESNLTHIGNSGGRDSIEKKSSNANPSVNNSHNKYFWNIFKILSFFIIKQIFLSFRVQYWISTQWEKPSIMSFLKPFWVWWFHVNLAISFNSTSVRMWLLFTHDIRKQKCKVSKKTSNRSVNASEECLYLDEST